MDLLAQSTESAPTPWGLLPSRMRVLFVTTPAYTGGWLVEAFANDSASRILVQEAVGMIAAMANLRTEPYDAVLLVHRPGELDAFELVEQLKTGCSKRQPIIVLGEQPAVEVEELCFELDVSYACLKTTTTRALIWQLARTTERHLLLMENDKLRQDERRRRELAEREAKWFIDQQHKWQQDNARKASKSGSRQPESSNTIARFCKPTSSWVPAIWLRNCSR